jgi:hypothetical protein
VTPSSSSSSPLQLQRPREDPRRRYGTSHFPLCGSLAAGAPLCRGAGSHRSNAGPAGLAENPRGGGAEPKEDCRRVRRGRGGLGTSVNVTGASCALIGPGRTGTNLQSGGGSTEGRADSGLSDNDEWHGGGGVGGGLPSACSEEEVEEGEQAAAKQQRRQKEGPEEEGTAVLVLVVRAVGVL